MSPELVELIKSVGPFILTALINAITMVISQARLEERTKLKIEGLEKENVVMREMLKALSAEKALDKDLQDFKTGQKEASLTLWTKIDGIREDVTECLRKLSRVEALQEIQQRSK